MLSTWFPEKRIYPSNDKYEIDTSAPLNLSIEEDSCLFHKDNLLKYVQIFQDDSDSSLQSFLNLTEKSTTSKTGIIIFPSRSEFSYASFTILPKTNQSFEDLKISIRLGKYMEDITNGKKKVDDSILCISVTDAIEGHKYNYPSYLTFTVKSKNPTYELIAVIYRCFEDPAVNDDLLIHVITRTTKVFHNKLHVSVYNFLDLKNVEVVKKCIPFNTFQLDKTLPSLYQIANKNYSAIESIWSKSLPRKDSDSFLRYAGNLISYQEIDEVLKPNGWLENACIQCVFQKIFDHFKKPNHFLINANSMNRISSPTTDFSTEWNWSNGCYDDEKSLFDAGNIIHVIYNKSGHWFYGFVIISEKTIVVLDSSDPKGSLSLKGRQELARHIFEYLKAEYVVNKPNRDFGKWVLRLNNAVPIQEDGSSCGVFIILFCLRAMVQNSFKDFEWNDILGKETLKTIRGMLANVVAGYANVESLFIFLNCSNMCFPSLASQTSRIPQTSTSSSLILKTPKRRSTSPITQTSLSSSTPEQASCCLNSSIVPVSQAQKKAQTLLSSNVTSNNNAKNANVRPQHFQTPHSTIRNQLNKAQTPSSSNASSNEIIHVNIPPCVERLLLKKSQVHISDVSPERFNIPCHPLQNCLSSNSSQFLLPNNSPNSSSSYGFLSPIIQDLRSKSYIEKPRSEYSNGTPYFSPAQKPAKRRQINSYSSTRPFPDDKLAISTTESRISNKPPSIQELCALCKCMDCSLLYMGDTKKSTPTTKYSSRWRRNSCAFDAINSAMQITVRKFSQSGVDKFLSDYKDWGTLLKNVDSGGIDTQVFKKGLENLIAKPLWDPSSKIDGIDAVKKHSSSTTDTFWKLIIAAGKKDSCLLFATFGKQNFNCSTCKKSDVYTELFCFDTLFIKSWSEYRNQNAALLASIPHTTNYHRKCTVCKQTFEIVMEITTSPMILRVCFQKEIKNVEKIPSSLNLGLIEYVLSSCIYGDGEHFVSLSNEGSSFFSNDGMSRDASYYQTKDFKGGYPCQYNGKVIDSAIYVDSSFIK